MSVGYPITRVDLDNLMGQLIVAVREDLSKCAAFKALLDDASVLPGSALTALGYSPDEVAQIQAAFTAMTALFDISKGAATQPAESDFWFFAKHLCGLNFR